MQAIGPMCAISIARYVRKQWRFLVKKTLIALTAAGALAAGTLAVPQQAHAFAWWWIPTAIVGGVVVGGAIAHSQARADAYGAYAYPQYGARGSVYVQPRGCRIVTERLRGGGYREVEVCR
jgi:hypothetical protein